MIGQFPAKSNSFGKNKSGFDVIDKPERRLYNTVMKRSVEG